MHGLVLVAAFLVIAWMLVDAFETILLPRRVPARNPGLPLRPQRDLGGLGGDRTGDRAPIEA
jgi:hypothetical protein